MTRQGAKAERDRRHAVETAKADKAKRATTVVEAMFDKDVCRATGRTLEGAAPLVSKRCVVVRGYAFTLPMPP